MSCKNNAISSDNPKAVEKLTEKLNKCEKEQEFMKKVNSYYKKNCTVHLRLGNDYFGSYRSSLAA